MAESTDAARSSGGPQAPSADGFSLFRAWWADVPSRQGSVTCKNYRREVFAACADIGKHPASVLPRDIERHLGELRPQHASLRRAALVDFFGFLERRGYRQDNPLAKIKSPKGGRIKVKRGWTEDELWRTVYAALWLGENGVRGTGHRLAYAILANYGLGLRPSEFLNLTKNRITLDGPAPCVFVTNTKTGNDRVVPLVGVARSALAELIALSPQDSSRIMHVGTTRYWEQIRAAAQLAGLEPAKCRPYAIRHTCATHLAERGVHIRVVAEILGHVDLRATMTYTQPGDELMRAALAKLGPAEGEPILPSELPPDQVADLAARARGKGAKTIPAVSATDLTELSAKLRLARGSLSMTTAARMLNVAPQTYKGWEDGRIVPRPNRAEALADFLHQDAEQLRALLGATGSPEEEGEVDA